MASTSGPSARMKTKLGRRRKVATEAPAIPASSRASGPKICLLHAIDETDEGHHHDQGPGSGFSQARPSIIWAPVSHP